MSDVFTEIKSLGISNIASHYGCDISPTGFSPCPACGASTRHTKRKDKRPACITIHGGNGWMCLQCQATGDSVDLLARFLNNGKRPTSPVEWRNVLGGFQNDAGGQGRARIATPYGKPPSEAAGGLLDRPPYPDLMSMWGRATILAPNPVREWLQGKFPKYTLEQIMDTGVVRFPMRHDNPSWWPWEHYYMAMLAFDSRGLVQSIHGRICKEPEEGRPKSRFPKGYSASGLVLANKTAVGWLRGKMPMQNVIIAEGLTSTVAATMAMRATDKWRWGVFGYTSGSNKAIEQMPWDGQTVYILTDDDKTGNLYADKIMKVLPGNVNLRRGTI